MSLREFAMWLAIALGLLALCEPASAQGQSVSEACAKLLRDYKAQSDAHLEKMEKLFEERAKKKDDAVICRFDRARTESDRTDLEFGRRARAICPPAAIRAPLSRDISELEYRLKTSQETAADRCK
jgi:hypothetical protein